MSGEQHIYNRSHPVDAVRVSMQDGSMDEAVYVRRDQNGSYVELDDVVTAFRALGSPRHTRLYLPEVYPKAVEPDEILYLGDRHVEVQPLKQQVFIGGKNVHFSKIELALLTTFAREPDTVLSREYLYSHAWRELPEGQKVSRTVDVHVKRIRDKLGGEPYSNPLQGLIQTRFKLGYVALRNMPLGTS